MKIGFIGVGNMGKPMARNLLKAGYSVSVYDLMEANVNELAAEGAIPLQDQSGAGRLCGRHFCLPAQRGHRGQRHGRAQRRHLRLQA